MNIWIAGLLALLIVIVVVVGFILIGIGVIWLAETLTARRGQVIVELIFGALAASLVLAMLGGLWYFAFSWLMGWPHV